MGSVKFLTLNREVNKLSEPISHPPQFPFAQYSSEKQGFAGAMEGALGPDAALVLGTVGAIMGSLAAVGVVLSTQNVNSICTTTKALGNTALTLSAASQFTGG